MNFRICSYAEAAYDGPFRFTDFDKIAWPAILRLIYLRFPPKEITRPQSIGVASAAIHNSRTVVAEMVSYSPGGYGGLSRGLQAAKTDANGHSVKPRQLGRHPRRAAVVRWIDVDACTAYYP